MVRFGLRTSRLNMTKCISSQTSVNSCRGKKPLQNRNRTIKFLRRMIKAINMKAMWDQLHHIVRCLIIELTAFAIIETSHIAMHMWDEPNPTHLYNLTFTLVHQWTKQVLPFLDEMDRLKLIINFSTEKQSLKICWFKLFNSPMYRICHISQDDLSPMTHTESPIMPNLDL